MLPAPEGVLRRLSAAAGALPLSYTAAASVAGGGEAANNPTPRAASPSRAGPAPGSSTRGAALTLLAPGSPGAARAWGGACGRGPRMAFAGAPGGPRPPSKEPVVSTGAGGFTASLRTLSRQARAAASPSPGWRRSAP